MRGTFACFAVPAATTSHATAAPLRSVTKSRRFTADVSRAFDKKDSTLRVRQETAALRHFNPAHVADGS
jgi:curli biogenesis system outer membrane secretion channel CsgG